ncbi:MAG: serine acetyltransferase [Aestuariivirga sp.]|uniref:serine O-acetyltransferase EpsC n=1 Tax=Aestuariivirga sp. TaxID=2650926 RepID=UPI0025BE1E1C|nr:serine O-acetyltransferase EpsC [Aestuariivirga sp.]MCA3560846.1 serine acetyltransferase [Aestuariivirga sp.]
MSAKIETLRPQRPRPQAFGLAAVVAELRHSRDVAHNIRLGGKVTEAPSASAIAEALDGIVMSLFPIHLGPHGLNHESIDLFVTNTLSTSLARLADQVARGLQFERSGLSPAEAQHRAEKTVHGLARQLPPIRALLVSDLKAAQRHDASAESLAEVLICYPSSRAIIHHRLAHALYRLGARFVARIIAALARATTGIDIHPGARIGRGFFISRGMGVTVGETAVIGENVCLHQGVTLGESEAQPPNASARRLLRHPIIEDRVIVHGGASILGRITIGAGSIIGGNVWLTRSVPPGSAVTHTDHTVSTIQSLDRVRGAAAWSGRVK